MSKATTDEGKAVSGQKKIKGKNLQAVQNVQKQDNNNPTKDEVNQPSLTFIAPGWESVQGWQNCVQCAGQSE